MNSKQEIDFGPKQLKFGQVLDRKQEISIAEQARPHWMQAGTITFITMRLTDSIPRAVIRRWDRERVEFLHRIGVDCSDWRFGQSQLSKSDLRDFRKHFRRLREDYLDDCHGKCRLRNADAAMIVADSLLHFENQRYLMGDLVVMPNHVHFLAVFLDAEAMRKQCTSWMKFTATQINRLNRENGPFWHPAVA
jgi:putative transposase